MMSGSIETGSSTANAGAELTVDLGAIAENWRLMRRRAGAAECAAVVKADAYGLGTDPVARVLHDAGCRTFFVALPDEGIRLRSILPDARIFVLNGLFHTAIDSFLANRLTPVLGSREEIDDWLSVQQRSPKACRPALHVDTGINRFGLAPDALEALAAEASLVEQLNPCLLMSHMACADEPDHPLNARQIEAFRQARTFLPGVPGSLANSAATLSGGEFLHDLVRPGVCLYGGRPHPTESDPIRDVVTLMARIVQIRAAQAGETVSYGASYTLERASRLATLSVGYADGLHRIAGSSDQAEGHVCRVGDYPAPILGRVTMDLIVVDVTDVPEDIGRRGAWVEVIGKSAPLADAAAAYKTIDYEVLTSLGRRFARRYITRSAANVL